MPSASPLVRRYCRNAWSRTPADRRSQSLAPDVVLHDRSSPERIRGREDHARYVEAYRSAIPDLRLVVDRTNRRGERVSVWAIVRGTHDRRFMGVAGDGNAVFVGFPLVLGVRGDRVVEVWVPGWEPFAEVLEGGGKGLIDPEGTGFDESSPWDPSIEAPAIGG